jgi:hypothetical protein
MSLPICLPARRDFYLSHRLLLLFALKKIVETGDSGAERNQKAIRKQSESNQKAIRKQSESNDSDKERNFSSD